MKSWSNKQARKQQVVLMYFMAGVLACFGGSLPLGTVNAAGGETTVSEENTTRTNSVVPSGISGVWVTLVGGGGGGGAGGAGTGGTRTGGGGGAGGATVERSFIPAASLGSTYSVTVGAGGGGGSPTDNASGDAGMAGGATSFVSGSVSVTAGGGGAGGGGTRTILSAGAAGKQGTVTVKGISSSSISSIKGGDGGKGGNATGTASSGDDSSGAGTAGGGGGGSRGSMGGRYAGGKGGNSAFVAGGVAGQVDTQNPGSSPANAGIGKAGAGGGGGSANKDGLGGAGGLGSSQGAGGGGGAGGDKAAAGGGGATGYTYIEWVPKTTVFMLAGTGGDSSVLYKFLEGQVTDGQTLVPIDYPNKKENIDSDMLTAARILNEKLTTTSGKKVVFAHSLGAVASSAWLKQYGLTSTVNPSELEFIFMGNSVRPYNGFYPLNNWTQTDGKPFVSKDIVSPIANTRFKVTDIALQYDGWADWPDIATSGTAISNAKSGKILYHLSYTNYPLDRYDYRKFTEGNITYVLIPINQWWLSSSSVNKIEAGYNRPE